ncbi:MAG: Ada metal-binding domain-containing protein [Phycisphaerae bacterium]|nr:Ada metal-binding domain-containing protein [Phycisphaerae bacterium]
MKTIKCYLVLAVAIGILCVPVIGEVEAAPTETKPILLGQPNPALAGIKQLYVVIPAPSAEPNSHGLVFNELEKLVTDKLKEAGITIAEPDANEMELDAAQAKMTRALRIKAGYADIEGMEFRHPRIPELHVYVEVLDVGDSQQVVFRVQMSLTRLVYLSRDRRPSFKTDIWRSEPIMQVTSAEDMPAAVTKVVSEQSEAFIHAYLTANHPNKQRPSDVNDVSVVPKKQLKPVVKSTTAEYKYVASKNSKVFHKLDCGSAKAIKPENLVGYSSRAEAIKAGKRPCKKCNP